MPDTAGTRGRRSRCRQGGQCCGIGSTAVAFGERCIPSTHPQACNDALRCSIDIVAAPVWIDRWVRLQQTLPEHGCEQRKFVGLRVEHGKMVAQQVVQLASVGRPAHSAGTRQIRLQCLDDRSATLAQRTQPQQRARMTLCVVCQCRAVEQHIHDIRARRSQACARVVRKSLFQ